MQRGGLRRHPCGTAPVGTCPTAGPTASPTGSPQHTQAALTIGGREIDGDGEIQLRPWGGRRAREAAGLTAQGCCLPAPCHGVSSPLPGTHCLGPPLPQPAPHSPGTTVLHPLPSFPTPLSPPGCTCAVTAILASRPSPMGGLGEPGGHPAPHSPAPDVVNEGELRLDRKGEQSHLQAWGGCQTRTPPPPPQQALWGGQTWPPTGRSPRRTPAPLTVPEFTYFFFLHFFLGFSTCGRRDGSALAWGAPPVPCPGLPPYLVHRELALRSGELPVAGGKLPDEVVATGGAWGRCGQAPR